MLKLYVYSALSLVLLASCSGTAKISNQLFNFRSGVEATRGTAHGPRVSEDLDLGLVTVAGRHSKEGSRFTQMAKTLKSGGVARLQTNKLELKEIKDFSDFQATNLQIKYAALLNIMPVLLSNSTLLKSIDYWYGTRYRYGGTGKRGIDCSAFTMKLFEKAFETDLPRTARQQYYSTQRIPVSELTEGDLVFFNTRGGVSHVGVYLKNNKFVHSSVGRGVCISDLAETYYQSRYIGAGRVERSAIEQGGAN